MKLNKLKLFSFCKLHFLLAALFLYLLFAVNWIPEERILEHSELSLQFVSEQPGNDFFPSDLAPMEDESALLLSLARNPEHSTLWNTLLGTDQGFRWNGVQTLLRPLLVFFHIGQIRYLCAIAFFLLLFCAAWKISTKFSFGFSFLFLFSVLWADILPVSYQLQHAGCFFIVFFAILLLLGKSPGFWKENSHSLTLIFYGIGAVTAFIDPMTIPVVTLGLPLAVLFLSIQKYGQGSGAFKPVALGTLSWGLGYVFLILTKWLLAVLLTGKNLFPGYFSRMSQECFRSLSSAAQIKQLLYENLNSFLSPAGFGIKALLFLALALTAAYVVLFFTGHKPFREIGAFLPLICIGLLPFLFYLLMPAHAFSDTGVTFRALIGTLYPFALFFFCALDTQRIRQAFRAGWKLFWRN